MNDYTLYANSIFEQPWWLNTVAPNQWFEVFVYKDEEVIGRFPYVYDGKNIFMPKLTQNIGFWIDDKYKNYGEQKKIIFQLFEQLPKTKSFMQTLSSNNTYILPFRWKGCSYEPIFTYRLQNLSNLDAIYESFSKTVKKNIRSAKNKVKISSELNFEHLWSLQNKTYDAQNRNNPIDREYMERIVRNCENHKCGQYFEAYDIEGNIHSCAYFIYDEKVCYYLLGCSDKRFRSSGSQSLIIWEAIKFASKHSQIFDFEGSNVEGIENFFRQFGGECIPLYTIKKLSFLNDVMLIAKPRIKKLIGYKN